MGEFQLLRNVSILNDIRQESGETLTVFYDRFKKSVTEVDKQIGEGKICVTFTRVSTSKKTKQLSCERHNTMKEIGIRVKGYIDMERTGMVADPYASIREPKRKERKKERGK